MRTLTSKAGTVYTYPSPNQKVAKTLVGGLLTGLLGVGIGEVVLPQLLRGGKGGAACVPVPVAAGTSVLTVIVSVAAASTVQWCPPCRFA